MKYFRLGHLLYSLCAASSWRVKPDGVTFAMTYDVNDPSFSVSGEYWQLGHAKASHDYDSWQHAARSIHQGLPVREEEFFRRTEAVTSPQFWGCIRDNNSYWIYRIYITGRDAHARPGRYFFVLFQVSSLASLSESEPSRIIFYLETQRSIPLILDRIPDPDPAIASTYPLTDTLYNGRPETPPLTQMAFAIQSAQNVPVGSHYAWIIDSKTVLKIHTDLPLLGKPSAKPYFRQAPPPGNFAPATSPSPISRGGQSVDDTKGVSPSPQAPRPSWPVNSIVLMFVATFAVWFIWGSWPRSKPVRLPPPPPSPSSTGDATPTASPTATASASPPKNPTTPETQDPPSNLPENPPLPVPVESQNTPVFIDPTAEEAAPKTSESQSKTTK